MIITKTPLRLSLIGGNTDFREYFLKYGGLALTATIDRHIYCIVKERFDNLIIVNYSEKETVTDCNQLKHDIVREALKLVGVESGIEISFLADIPSGGTGLGSSSAVAIGVLNALHTFKGENVSSWQLAEEAIKIELDILSKPIGVQDQYAIAYGGIRSLEFKKSGKVEAERVAISESVQEDFNNSLMLLYTGLTRSSEEILSTFNPDKHLKILDLNKQLAAKGIVSLVIGNLKEFGRNLHSYWIAKKKLNRNISTTGIDEMYQKAMDAGAIGGKVVGAGGGGFLLVMFPANKRAKIREAMKEYKELPFRFSNTGSKVIFNA